MQQLRMEVAMTDVLLGTMTFGDTVDLDAARAMVDQALAMGIDHIDTANVYSTGDAERMLGKLLAGRRDEVTLATKVGMPSADAGPHAPLSAAAITRCVEASLGRLCTDRVDLLYLHQPDRSTPLEETLGVVAELQRQGKVVEFGLSNYSAWMTVDVERAAVAAGVSKPTVGQQLLNLVARRLEDEYVEMARAHGLRTAAYNPLGGGLLTGLHSVDTYPDAGRFGDSRLAAMYQARYWSPSIFEAIRQYQRIATDAGMTLLELALRWVAGHEYVDAVIVGASKVEHVVTNVDLLRRGRLTDDLIDSIDAVGADLRGPMPAYHR
jgi:aryl-alcohol dehydrogenase-like predicted oxidoreductase